jgi:integrase
MRRDAEGRPVFPENCKLRSARHRVAIVERLIYPALGKHAVSDIRRSDVIKMLDRIAEASGPVMADHTLAILRRVLNWHMRRDDEFISPIRSGMARTRPSERTRERMLNDDELRAVWRAAEAEGGPWGSLLRFLLLTCARRNEAKNLTRAEVNGDLWVIPVERVKTKREVHLPLSKAAQGLLATMPVIGKGQLVFTTDGHTPIGGFTVRKREFDEACGVVGWTLHDLRRTSRSLLARAGVADEVAERCLGHKIGGVLGTYNRRKYVDEMRLAFETLAGLIELIVNPKENVLPMTKSAAPNPG